MSHKILIVDDEENVRLVVKEAFSGAYQVLTAFDGVSAVELIKRERPTVVFLDIKMPGISGVEVLRLVKEAGVSSIIWMLTGEEDLETALKTLQLGAAGYLTKPFEVSKLRDIVLNEIENVSMKGKSDDKPWRVEKDK
jgi:two-component system response regulator (stage 0 sporulation protein F)